MEVEKRGMKGGFLQLFDWNAKSRKKLFSSKSELHESLNQGKENFHGSELARVEQGLENRFAPNARGHNYYHYASSVSGDSEYGTKAPGVVARLMGLDSLPTTNVTEPCFTPFIDSHSFRDSSYLRSAPALQSEHDIVIFESVRNKLDGLTRNPLDPRLQKVHNRPIERFQKEVLPPKSAKPISITQHRLLSPVKSPGFIPPKNAAYIIEAAAKIIEQSPRSTIKGKLPSLGSSYGPLRVQDLKDKMESAKRSSQSADASQKCKEHNSIKNMKKQHSTKGQVRSADSYLYKGFEESKKGSQRLKSKEKSVSLAVLPKPSIQKRDGLASADNRSSEKQKEHSDIKPSYVSRNLPNTQKNVEKRSSSRRPSEVLRLNHQKQNSVPVKDGENFEPSSSHPKDRKESCLSANHIHGRANRTVDKIVVNNVVTSRKTNVMAADPGKELSSSRSKTTSKKKLHINGNIQSDGSVAKKPLVMNDEKSVRCNAAFEGDCEWDTIDKKNNLDVVSFTFTSPIKKSGAGSNSRGTISEITRSLFPSCDPFVRESDLGNSAAPSSGFNVIGGDSLSVLLEIKLKELTSRVELSQQDLSEASSFSSSANIYGNMGPTVSLSNSLPMNNGTSKGKQEIQNGSDCPYVDKCRLKAEKENKGLEHMEEDGNNSNIDYQRYNNLQGSSSVSNQPSFSEASCNSFDVDRSLSNEGSVQCLSLESYEGINWSSTRKSHTTEGDMEISDTASSLSVGTMSETVTSSLYMPDSKDSSCWELQYIGDILCSAELMLEEFALGGAYKVIALDFFHQLENQKMDSNKLTEEHFKLQRKVLFDCVGECLEVRCGRLLAGSKVWAKQTTLFNKRQWLAEEVYREISSWTNIEELMVDDLVDKDMSSKNGQWIDFETEAFEEGVEIEKRILTSLVDELIDDFLFLSL
ncbi:hypothetical protein Pfo_005187 [Paulownia fortunei]|nr:hypothetical protein Pfo_005187 [Paulownia fortunei]